MRECLGKFSGPSLSRADAKIQQKPNLEHIPAAAAFQRNESAKCEQIPANFKLKNFINADSKAKLSRALHRAKLMPRLWRVLWGCVRIVIYIKVCISVNDGVFLNSKKSL